MGQEYPPEKDTKHSAPAPLRRRLHEFYFGGSRFVVLRAANRTAPDLSFRTPPRGATACRETVFLLLANTLRRMSQLCRTRIIKRDKIIPRKSLQPNNWQKNFLLHPPTEALGCPFSGLGKEDKKRPLAGIFPDKRSCQRALQRPKGDGRGKRNVPDYFLKFARLRSVGSRIRLRIRKLFGVTSRSSSTSM